MSQLIQITDKSGRQVEEKPLDLAEVRAKLAATNGKGYWRSLEELSEQPGFTEMLRREFPGQAPKDWAPLPRRDFVKLMGAALALAGLSGCAAQPPEKIVSYVEAPDDQVPGISQFYATSMPFMGYGLGLLAESREGRPIKIEGNPEHPATLGRTDVWAQASVLNLYDPDRSQFIRQSGSSSNWDAFTAAATAAVATARANGGAGLTILTETVTSPSQLDLLANIRRQLPGAKWHSYEPVNRDNVRAGTRLAMGRDLHPVYHFERADVIVSLDCDFLLEEPDHIANAREFISKRKLTEGSESPSQKTMSRLYVIESTPSITGGMADNRLPMKASQVDGFARALAGAVGVAGVTGTVQGDQQTWVNAIADDLKANRGSVLVVAGAHQPPAVHALAQAMTATLGSVGASSPLSFHAPVEGNPKLHGEALAELVADMNAGRVQTLLIMGANPVYSAPADLKFAQALGKVPLRIHHGIEENETSVLCNWHIPEAHYLETWGDLRSVDGTYSVVQPLIQPLYGAAKSPLEMLALFAGNGNVSSYDVVRGYQLRRRGGQDNMAFDKFWNRIVHDGYIPGTAAPAVGATLSPTFAASLPAATPAAAGTGFEVTFRPDPTIWDGRFANNGWLQECPKPVSKITWDNAFYVSANLAKEQGWKTNDEATLTLNGRTVTGGIFLLPGQPDGTVTVHLGYGRTLVGKIGTGAGFNANLIRTSDSPWIATGATIKKTGGVFKLATTTHHNLIAPQGKDTTFTEAFIHSDAAKTKVIDNILNPDTRDLDIDGLHGRDIVRAGTFADYQKNILPTSERDKRGVPLAYPANPKPASEVKQAGKDEGGAHAKKDAHGGDHGGEHGGGHGEHGPVKVPGMGSALYPVDKKDLRGGHERPIADDRELEGYPSFYPRNADPLALKKYKDESLNEADKTPINAWGMTVDLHSCIGCNACVIGCQSENNSAIVGKDQVLMGREMHWIRIDTYYRGSYENPEVYFEPMMCQHCEKAPCAPVCPFNAVMNSPEGINEQIYNRCVGTKYCENNCPYKVRRFNFLQYADQQTPVIQLMANPDVTVRSRGVMEKCTYCIQRVKRADWQADKENRRIRDGEIQVACQQACPTDAIVFGDINDPNSRVSKLKRGPLTFGLLTELNTMPRTSYLARFKNPNPALAALDKPATLAGAHSSEGHIEEAMSESSAKPH